MNNNKKFFERHDNNYFYGENRKSSPLPPGYYIPPDSMQGQYLLQNPAPEEDVVVDLEEGPTKEVFDDINTFLSPETRAAFKKYGMLYRRGILVHGKPGTGKSVIFRSIAKKFVEEGGICFWDIPPATIANHAAQIKERIKDQKILVVYEELEVWLQHSEHSLLQLLDGHMTLDNAVYLTSTNYIDHVPDRIKNRPSRIARVVEVGPPSAKIRKEFLMKRIHRDDLKALGKAGIDKIVEKTEGMVIDHLKELIVSAFCMKVPVEDAIQRMRELNFTEEERKPHSHMFRGEVKLAEACEPEPALKSFRE